MRRYNLLRLFYWFKTFRLCNIRSDLQGVVACLSRIFVSAISHFFGSFPRFTHQPGSFSEAPGGTAVSDSALSL